MEELLLRDAELDGRQRCDVRVVGTEIVAIGQGLDRNDGVEIACDGAALLPGLHDHHCHLMAMAADAGSVRCGPPSIVTRPQLFHALRGADGRDGWIRGVGYHESVAGVLDRAVLDEARSDIPVRVQDRSGALWTINSAAVRALGLDIRRGGADAHGPEGVEYDAAGWPTGRLWRMDAWLREHLGARPIPDLGSVSRLFASFGVTGVTDATPDLDPVTLGLLRGPDVRQRVTLLGDPAGSSPRKIMVTDHVLPTYDSLAEIIRSTRPRPVAVHCVTRVSLVLTMAVLRDVGSVPGDRIEHAAVVPPDVREAMRDAGVCVVTQPSFVAARGDDYLESVDADDLEHLWPYRSLLDAGIGVACSSDAPYGDPDPWTTVRAAVNRRAPSGRGVAVAERVAPLVALQGFLTGPAAPGGPSRRVRVGAVADLVLLDAPLREVLDGPSARRVRMTLIGGHRAFESRSPR